MARNKLRNVKASSQFSWERPKKHEGRRVPDDVEQNKASRRRAAKAMTEIESTHELSDGRQTLSEDMRLGLVLSGWLRLYPLVCLSRLGCLYFYYSIIFCVLLAGGIRIDCLASLLCSVPL